MPRAGLGDWGAGTEEWIDIGSVLLCPKWLAEVVFSSGGRVVSERRELLAVRTRAPLRGRERE